MDIANRIKQVRGNISQEDFAQQTGVHKSSLGRYERGESVPDSSFLSQVCSIFDINPQWLLLGTGPMTMASYEPIVRRNSAQVSPETTNMLSQMQDKLSFIEAGVAANRVVLNSGHASSATCEGCAALQEKLDKANERLEVISERLYKSMSENNDLKDELINLHKEITDLKNKLLSATQTNDGPMASAS